MDKYQKALLASGYGYIGFSCGQKMIRNHFDEEGKIFLQQDPDIMICDYMLYITNISVAEIYAIKDGKEVLLEKERDPIISNSKKGECERFCCPIDFKSKTDAVRLVFKRNLADDLVLPIVYEDADEQAYYAEKEKKRKEAFFASAAIKCSTGLDLVNVYFQPCCDAYDHSEVQLFIPSKENKLSSRTKSWTLIKKCTVAKDEFFLTVSGLAYGTYAYILKQFDDNGNLLLETEYQEFHIHPHHSIPQRNCVVIR